MFQTKQQLLSMKLQFQHFVMMYVTSVVDASQFNYFQSNFKIYELVIIYKLR